MKDFDPNARVIIFKATIKVNGEIEDAKIVDLFSFTLRDNVSKWSNNCMGDYPNSIFVEL